LRAIDTTTVSRNFSVPHGSLTRIVFWQVLDYSKLEHSVNQDVVVEAAPFHLSQVCDELLDVVVARAASRKVKFIFEDWSPIPFLVGDKFRLRQVLINLADNAVKFCPDENGIVVVSVTSEPIDNGTIMVQIDVTDNGIGIAEKKRDLIFQPFSQVGAQIHACICQSPGSTIQKHP
jgi:signal transduction histidine kinase